MRRTTALLLFVLGYALMAMLSPAVAALPAVALFALAGLVLVTRPADADPAERVARELLRDA